MQIKLFTIPISDTGVMVEEMNRFLRGNKILETQQQLVNNERGAYWCFCIKYLEQLQNNAPYTNVKEKQDYKQILDEPTFKKFTKLREIRKQLALEDAVPAYAIFTDEELAGIAQLETLDIKGIKSIKGIGVKKVEKYAQKIIDAFNNTPA